MAANKKAAAQPTSSDESKPSEDVVVEAALEEENTEPAEAQLAQSITPEQPDEEEKAEIETTEDESKSVTLTDFSPSECVYPTAFYAGSGIPYCAVCGEADRNDGEGNPICIENRSDCPRK